jgi:hypothetical protein
MDDATLDKEKGLLLHPPFAKVTSQAQQRP